MKYQQFTMVPQELKLKIIRKCYPIPYVRLRQSCHFVDDLCEHNRRQLGIYCYRKDPTLSILHSNGAKTKNIDVDGRSYYLCINYGQDKFQSNFGVTMTKENIHRIRRSLSGFAITHFKASEGFLGPKMVNGEYDRALDLFLEIASDFQVKNMDLTKLEPEQVRKMLDIWSVEHLSLSAFQGDFMKLLELKPAKNVSSVSINSCSRMTAGQIVELARGRKSLYIWSLKLTASIVWDALNAIFERWEKVTDAPDTIRLDFYMKCDNRKKNELHYEQCLLFLPLHTVHFGGFISRRRGECDLYVIQAQQMDHWRILLIHRNAYGGGFFVETARSRDDLIMILIGFIQKRNVYYRTSPLDFSSFHTSLKQETSLESIRQEFKRLLRIIVTNANKE